MRSAKEMSWLAHEKADSALLRPARPGGAVPSTSACRHARHPDVIGGIEAQCTTLPAL